MNSLGMAPADDRAFEDEIPGSNPAGSILI